MSLDLKCQIEESYRLSVAGMDIPWMLEQWALRRPDKPALIWCPFNGDEETVTYSQLFTRARRLAAGLHSKGVRCGDFVLLHMDNSAEFVQSWYACAILGAVAVSTNTRSVGRDLSYFVDVTKAVCALSQPKFADLIADACPDLKFIALTDSDAGESVENYATIMERTKGAVPFTDLFADEPIELRKPDAALNLGIQFTSGTTSRPKAVVWTHANGIWAGKSNTQHYRLREDDVTLTNLPLFHTNAQSYSMLSTHWSGGTMVLQPKFSASRYWDLVMRHGVTWASMIPFGAKALIDKPVPDHKMRFWSFGVQVPESEELFGVPTLGLWGMTETVSHGTYTDPDHLGPRLNIGRAAPGYDIQIRDAEGNVLGPGSTGRMYIRGVRGVSVFKEYYGNPEATAEAFDEDGWLDTGDIASIDEEGWFYFRDRDKDMLRVGAENVAASEVETVLMMTGLASECAVVGQQHFMLDEVPVAFVIPAPGLDLAQEEIEAQMIDHCRANLPDFKVVRRVFVVDELPRSTLEKVSKKDLRDRLEPITE